MSLKEYEKKRDFSNTPEPSGERTGRSAARELTFVVQRHDASRLHFDFRLEVDGVMKSWAVPKGPSMNPAEKRLAVMTEDHPLEYAGFEGKIPEGNYGAGTVEIWDSGTYTPAEKDSDIQRALSDADGVFEFTLHGGKLKGLFDLIRTGFNGDKKNWLLVKKKDEYSVSKPYDASEIPSHEKVTVK